MPSVENLSDTVGSDSKSPSTQNSDTMLNEEDQSDNDIINTLEEDEEIPIRFPVAELLRLDEMISNPRWVVPVLPGGQLEVLLDASIILCKRGLDLKSEACQRFFREGLTISFTKILTDDAVSSWKPEIHKCILKNSERLVDLICTKLDQDWFPLLDLLSILFNPMNKFHSFNAGRQPESSSDLVVDDEMYGRSPDTRLCKGWLVDLINRFGINRGFDVILERFHCEVPLSVNIVFALLRPFGLCSDFLTEMTIDKYFTQILRAVPQFLENLSDDDLKKETAKSDIISSIIKCLKNLQARIPESEEQMRNLELFRLRMILRMLQVSSFNGKMNALNEINQVIQNQNSHYPSHHCRLEDMEYLTSHRIAEWLSENQVLQIVLRDSLHQPQYVEKLEKILRFIIKERSLTLLDLDDIWAAQVGKHDAIVKNVHDLLAKLAWDFSPEQLDHLFECFQASWTNANKRQREKLLELIRRLAEDDKEGVMAHKVLSLFWNLALSNEVPTEIMDQALTAHVKVLDYSCSQQRDNQKLVWLNLSMDQLVKDDVVWVIPAMKHMKDIFCLYPEAQGCHKATPPTSRQAVIERMKTERHLIVKVCDSLNTYMDKIRIHVKEKGIQDPSSIKLDGRYTHMDQVRERLTFLRFLLKDGNLYLCEPQANLIWQSLAEAPVTPIDREMCFDWFSKLMGDEPDLEPQLAEQFFERKILNFDATLLTENGMDCFERFFKTVNVNKKSLFVKKDEILMDSMELIGTDYIWRIILSGSEDMANRAISFLRLICTALGPQLMPNQKDVHEDFISSCTDRLKASFDTILILEKDKDSINRVRQEVTKTCRVLRVLYEYIIECDADYGEERAFLPLEKASRGKNFSIYVRFGGQGQQRGFDDIEVHTHANETPAGLRRNIIRLVKEHLQTNTAFKLDLFYNTDIIDLSDDRRTVAQFGLRDKMTIQAKVIQSNVTNSPDSSEESSGGSPNHFAPGTDGPNVEAEEVLPSVMMSMDEKRMEFLCKLCQLGANLNEERLREAARTLLSVLPLCRNTAMALKNSFLSPQASFPNDKKFGMLFNTDPVFVLYRLEVLYSLLFPANNTDSRDTLELLSMFFVSGGAGMVVEMLTKNNFMPLADVSTKRSAYLSVLKLTKAVLAVAAHLFIRCESEAHPAGNERLFVIKEAVKTVPNTSSEFVLRRVAEMMSMSLQSHLKNNNIENNTESLKSLLQATMDFRLPDIETIRLIIRLATSTATGSLAYFLEQHQANRDPHEDDAAVCEEALETLTLSFVLNPLALEQLITDPNWKTFLHTVLFHTQGRNIRFVANQQIFAIATKSTGKPSILNFFTMFLFDVIQNLVQELPHHSHEAFNLLCGLLRYSSNMSFALAKPLPFPKHEQLLTSQIEWLRKAKEFVKVNGEGTVQDELLEGHINVAKELINFLGPEKKFTLGCEHSGGLLREILVEFVFPWSKAYSAYKRFGDIPTDPPVQICSTSNTQNAILDLVVAMCTGCYQNLKLTVDMLTELFHYSNDGDNMLNEWEYIPPIGSRPLGGFVGLKNAGATCYMNSVMQQLFMVENIKKGVLGASFTDDVIDDGIEDGLNSSESDRCISVPSDMSMDGNGDDRKSYNVCILRQVQAIFGHLALSKIQYYVPNGLWKHFRLQGEAVNLREQQDAVEFFMSLIESVDDGLKAIDKEQVMSKNLGGLFSDQKICKECPHRYSKEEPFSVISVDIRNHSNLCDSLEQYVKGELLEGADAYHCERCSKKVVTVKRLCVKKLPPVLAIQLKRFEYDYERVCPIKFNDYFEFPRDLDMEPYTVSGLAKIEGEMIDSDDSVLLGQNMCSTYRLTGIVVHSGQASGGHYYSYISFKCPDGQFRWYKFDDGDVAECRMDDDDELKNQCFGGDYSGEVFDHMMKRMSFRRQKRWWNAYILFYTQTEVLDASVCGKFISMAVCEKRLKIPTMIERNVLKQNVEFMHIRTHFSSEYFQFIKRLVNCNVYALSSAVLLEGREEEVDQLGLLSVQLATQFLFSVGFRTKKALRGIANEWHDILIAYLRHSKNARFWFATYALFRDPCRIAEYLLECPSSEVRQVFSKLLVYLAHASRHDGPYTPLLPMATLTPRNTEKHLWEFILEAVLNLLRRDVSEYGRHLIQYFAFFVNYALMGDEEKLNLLTLSVPLTFMQLAVDEGPAPPIKYQCAELGKLYLVVSMLIRSCDVSHRCKRMGAQQGEQIPSNPFAETGPLETLPDSVCNALYERPEFLNSNRDHTEIKQQMMCSSYIKKIIDEIPSNSEDTLRLLQFLCWENWSFSQQVLAEVLCHIGYSYTGELKSFLEMLISLLKIEDSWQAERINSALHGLPEEKDGILDIIHRNKSSHPKRAYLFVKCVVAFTDPNTAAHRLLSLSPELARKWNSAVDWLNHELDRRGPACSSYGYPSTSWAPPSNETSNGSFFLERSVSAKLTLEKAMDLRIDPERGENEDDQISSEGEEEGPTPSSFLDDGKVTRDRDPNVSLLSSSKLRQFRKTRTIHDATTTPVRNTAPPNTPPSSNENLQAAEEPNSPKDKNQVGIETEAENTEKQPLFTASTQDDRFQFYKQFGTSTSLKQDEPVQSGDEFSRNDDARRKRTFNVKLRPNKDQYQ